MFEALERRFGVAAVLQPALSPAHRRLLQALAFHPDRDTWRRSFNLHPRTFSARTARARELLAAHPGRLVVQLHTLMGTGGGHAYVLHTDGSYRLTERDYPEGAPLRGRARARYLDLETEVYRGAAAHFPRSAWLARSLVEDYGCDPARVTVVGAGNNLPLSPLEGRRRERPTALYVGYEWERKGGQAPLRAWERVNAALPAARLQVVGVPRAPRHLPAGVEWLGVVRDRRRLAALFEQAGLFVMPSLFEPWGHVFLEAMAAGLPCVGTSICAMPEIIAHGETGLLVPRRDPDALAGALVALLSDSARAARMGRAGQERIRRGWTWDDVVARMAPAIEAAQATPG